MQKTTGQANWLSVSIPPSAWQDVKHTAVTFGTATSGESRPVAHTQKQHEHWAGLQTRRLTKGGPLCKGNQVLSSLTGISGAARCGLEVQLLHSIYYSILHPCHTTWHAIGRLQEGSWGSQGGRGRARGGERVACMHKDKACQSEYPVPECPFSSSTEAS